MPKRWEREQMIAHQYMENVRAYTWFDLAVIEGDIVFRKPYSGGIIDVFTIRIIYPPDFLHAQTPEGFIDDAPTYPEVSMLSHRDRWTRRVDGHILSDWSLCLFVPGEADINFRDFHSLKQFIEVVATFLRLQQMYQKRILNEKAPDEAKWPGPQRDHGLPGYIQAIQDRGGMRDDELCICGSGKRFGRCHKVEVEREKAEAA